VLKRTMLVLVWVFFSWELSCQSLADIGDALGDGFIRDRDILCLPKIPSQWRKHRINNIQVQRVAAEPRM